MPDNPSLADPAPGWYVDSPNTARLRWWNGASWTNHYLPPSDVTSEVLPDVTEIAPAKQVDCEPPSTRAVLRARTRAAATEGSAAGGERGAAPADAASLAAPSTTAPTDARSAAGESQVSHGQPNESDGQHAGAGGPDKRAAATSPSVPPPHHRPLDEDPILARPLRSGVDRMPPPIEYRSPITDTIRVSTTLPTAVLSPRLPNGPARTSLVLIVLGVIGGGAAYLWRDAAEPGIATVALVAAVLVLLLALTFAIVGIVVSIRRPTPKGQAVVALVLSSLLLMVIAMLVLARVLGPTG